MVRIGRRVGCALAAKCITDAARRLATGTSRQSGGPVKEALNKSILDFSARAIEKAWFSDDSQNQPLAAADFGSASLRR